MIRTWKPSPVEYDRCNRKARRDGLFAGVTSGLFAAIFGERFLRFDRRKTMMSGLLTGALAGYFFSQAFLSTYLGQLEQETLRRAQLETSHDSQTETELMRGVPHETTK